MKQTLKLGIIAILFSTIIIGCKKYDEGGALRKAEKQIQTTWVLSKYFRNDVDETNLIYINDYEETYGEESYSRSYVDVDNEEVDETGSYSFSDDKLSMDISNVSSIDDFSDEHSSLSSSTYNILKLTKDELWYYYENGGDMHEFRFTAK